MRTALRRRPTAVLLAVLALAPGAVLAGCGGGGDEQDAEALLDRTFSQPIASADLELDAELDVDGLEGFGEPVTVRASGPYIRQRNKLPKLDVDIEIGERGAGQAIQTGILSTGDRVFLKFGGAFFEQEPEQVAQTNRRLARDGGSGSSLADLGLDPRAWVVDAAVEGEEEVGGVQTEHVSGELDVKAMLTDLNELVEQSAGALGTDGEAPQPLGKDDVERLSNAVEDPSFDVYVGKDDDVLRRISISLDLAVPEDDRQDVGGITRASIRLSAELSDVGGDQRVQAPRTAQPISALTDALGGLGGLTGAGGLGGAASDRDQGTTPDAPAGGGGSSGAGGSEAGVDDFERYGDCLEQAAPDDTDAIARCAQLVD